MREIKFRIVYKNKINGYERLTDKDGNIFWEWMALDLNPDNGNERWCPGVYPKDFSYLRNQFTGLKDKNGREIYEGDIMKELIFEEQIGRHSVSANCELIGSVEFNERQAKFIVKMVKNNLNIISSEFGWGYERFEVIGNIYEHPELVTPK